MAVEENVRPEDELLSQICSDIVYQLPKEPVNIEEIMVIFPTLRENSMNTVLT